MRSLFASPFMRSSVRRHCWQRFFGPKQKQREWPNGTLLECVNGCSLQYSYTYYSPNVLTSGEGSSEHVCVNPVEGQCSGHEALYIFIELFQLYFSWHSYWHDKCNKYYSNSNGHSCSFFCTWQVNDFHFSFNFKTKCGI